MEKCHHPRDLVSYPGSLSDLAKEIGNMTYDQVAEFLSAFSLEIKRQSEADFLRKRVKLAHQLEVASNRLNEASVAVGEAWTICAPYTD